MVTCQTDVDGFKDQKQKSMKYLLDFSAQKAKLETQIQRAQEL